MILLTVIAVGLLTISEISLRSSGQGNAMATARANARLGLIMAIGELQKNAGPDQRVTARADILDAGVANPRLTGVWKSWDIKADSPPSASDYEKATRDTKFVGWLASGKDLKKVSEVGYAGQSTADPVKLWGNGSLGGSVGAADIVTASKVITSPSRGGFAWAVMDEGLKVRINTPHVDAADGSGLRTAQLGSGVRPNTASVAGLGKLERSLFEKSSTGFESIGKGITPLMFGLAAETLATGTGELLKPLLHDVTSVSRGLLTNAASGGLKEDFSLLMNQGTLPSGYDGRSVYDQRLGITGPSDPRWEAFHQFSRLYRDSTRMSSTNGVPVIKARGPAGWIAATGSNSGTGTPGTPDPAPPPGVVLMPTIAKVQIVFSLLTRDIYKYPKPGSGISGDVTPKKPGTKAEETSAELHVAWGRNFAGSSYDYLLHLLYTPVITVHNPYNVAIEFEDLKVVFGNVPFAIQVFRNGQPQTSGLAPLDTMFHEQSETGKLPKRFGMNLKTNRGSPSVPLVGSGTFRLLPGEVMMFSPYIQPSRTWADEQVNRTFSDYDSGSGATRTLTIDALPGWRGDGVGFDLDWFCPSYNNLRVTSFETENDIKMERGGCIGAKSTDEFFVKFAPLSVESLSKNKFTVEMFAKSAGSNASVSSGIIELDYEKPSGLQESLLGNEGTITFPKGGTINAMEMHSHSLTPIKDIATTKPFAVVSAQAKTTFGGLNPDGEDGRLATKPWCFAHAPSGVSSGRIVNDHPANLSHEFGFQLLENGTSNLFQFDPKTGRGNFITGLTGETGLKFGSMYDIPLAPVQTLVGLNGANPGGSSGYLPRFARPIGNSWAHPMLDPSQLVTGGTYPLLDHSFLLNLALYDNYFFSGLAEQTGPFIPSSKSTKILADRLVAGDSPADPRIAYYQASGKASGTFANDATAVDAHTRIASQLVVNGAFNINSTSVAAWKAMLGSIHDTQALVNRINKANRTSALTPIRATDPSKGEARISRFRLPASESASDPSVEESDAYWLGAREYTDAELQILAEKIVGQVRLRGPFLSLSEFVNRRLGTGELALKGALQQAIDEADLNRDIAESAAAGTEIPSSKVSGYKYQNSAAGAGSSYQGAPGYLSQSDLLAVLGNAATARSDTFTVRAYGEARDGNGKITASAVCEALVQRVPEYVDRVDSPETAPASLSNSVNKTFGRRFVLISFRWMTPSEI
jgi:hypothetical protein